MNEGEIREVLFTALEKALKRPLDRAALHDNVNLKEDLELDSLSLIEAVWDVEEKLGVRVGEDQLKTIRTVGDVVKAIREFEPQAVATTV